MSDHRKPPDNRFRLVIGILTIIFALVAIINPVVSLIGLGVLTGVYRMTVG